MENNGNPTTKTSEAPNGTTLQLVVVWDQVTGGTQVSGPIQNLVICLGMLESAKNAIVKFHEKAAADSRIITAGAMPNLRM